MIHPHTNTQAKSTEFDHFEFHIGLTISRRKTDIRLNVTDPDAVQNNGNLERAIVKDRIACNEINIVSTRQEAHFSN